MGMNTYDDTWVCTVTHDAETDGQAASASVEITSPVFVYVNIAKQDGW